MCGVRPPFSHTSPWRGRYVHLFELEHMGNTPTKLQFQDIHLHLWHFDRTLKFYYGFNVLSAL